MSENNNRQSMKNVRFIVGIVSVILFFGCGLNKRELNTPTVKNDSIKPKVISDSTNTLTGKIENLELEYMVWGCSCANWITVYDRIKYDDGELAQHCIFIEPSDKSIELPLHFDPFRHRIKVTGQFYTRPDYPQGTIEMEEPLEKAKVFRYSEIKIVTH
jgi:hypothetical protein